MSFYIKQYRDKGNHWSEITKNEYKIGEIQTQVAYFAKNQYTDTTIDMSSQDLITGEKYFLSVEIERIGAGTEDSGNPEMGNTEKEIVIKLLNGDDILDIKNQYIETIILPKAERVGEQQTITKSVFNFIIAPNDKYQRIAFILKRDLTNINDIKLSANITVKKFFKLNNLIGDAIKVSGSNVNITQIGVHARPGTLMCINGEAIRIGKRGVFELNSVFRLQQRTSSNDSQDSTIETLQNSDIVGIYFLNIINENEDPNNESTKELYTIDYRYVQMKEATQ